MDLQSFCVESRRKVHHFPFLRSAVQSTEKMDKSFQFGVPVGGPTMENCFKNIHNISCNAQFTFQGITKNQDCHTKKSSFDHFNKFSHFTFSRVVGGFVGSKSQGGSASREPHQVWDVILRQLDTACQATMNNNAQQYFSIGEAVSQSIFGQFNNCKNSSLDFTQFLFAEPCDFFASKKTSGNTQSSNDHCQANSVDFSAGEQVKSSKVPCNSESPIVIMEKKESMTNMGESEDMKNSSIQQITAKQSYADVAKAYIASKSQSMRKTERYPSTPMSSLPQKNIFQNCRYSRRKNEKGAKKISRLNGSCYTQPSYNYSSQNQQLGKSPVFLDKCEECIPSKLPRGKFEHLGHFRTENMGSCKSRPKEAYNSRLTIPAKDSKGQEDRKPRFNKFRSHNMREKERKCIDQQVHEDIVYGCNMPEEFCQNWRCDHNRISSVPSRAEFGIPRREFMTKNCKQQSRLHSPPPRTLIPDCVKVNKPKAELCPKKEISDISRVGEVHEETLCNNEIPNICTSLDLSGSGESCGESLFSSSPAISTVVLPQRQRVASECSVDSEDSVVFERDDHDLDDTESDHELDSDSGSDFSSECDSDDDDDCDEVDFCYDIPAENVTTGSDGTTCPDAFSLVPDRMKDINAKWQAENSNLPKVEKVSEKVHFPSADKLTKIHRMVHWPFAYREARRGPWEEIGRDRGRFQLRIERAEQELSRVLDPDHRRRIWEDRMCKVVST